MKKYLYVLASLVINLLVAENTVILKRAVNEKEYIENAFSDYAYDRYLGRLYPSLNTKEKMIANKMSVVQLYRLFINNKKLELDFLYLSVLQKKGALKENYLSFIFKKKYKYDWEKFYLIEQVISKLDLTDKQCDYLMRKIYALFPIENELIAKKYLHIFEIFLKRKFKKNKKTVD